MEQKINKRFVAHINEGYLQRLYLQHGADTQEKKVELQNKVIDEIRKFVRGESEDNTLITYDFTDSAGETRSTWWLEHIDCEEDCSKHSMTEAEFYMMGYMACVQLANVLDIRYFYPKPTEEDYQAICKTRDMFARMLARTIRDKVSASEFFDNDSLENIRRYFSKANEADLIDLNSPTGEEEKAMIAEADKHPKKDMPFWLRMVKAIRGKENKQ